MRLSEITTELDNKQKEFTKLLHSYYQSKDEAEQSEMIKTANALDLEMSTLKVERDGQLALMVKEIEVLVKIKAML